MSPAEVKMASPVASHTSSVGNFDRQEEMSRPPKADDKPEFFNNTEILFQLTFILQLVIVYPVCGTNEGSISPSCACVYCWFLGDCTSGSHGIILKLQATDYKLQANS